MDLLTAINAELLSRSNITETAAEALKNISVQQHHSRKVAETLIDYPSLREELISRAKLNHITKVNVTVRSATGHSKPFWEFKDGCAELVINEH
jgi:hypothetical protein